MICYSTIFSVVHAFVVRPSQATNIWRLLDTLLMTANLSSLSLTHTHTHADKQHTRTHQRARIHTHTHTERERERERETIFPCIQQHVCDSCPPNLRYAITSYSHFSLIMFRCIDNLQSKYIIVQLPRSVSASLTV